VGTELVWVKAQEIGSDVTGGEAKARADLVIGEVTQFAPSSEVDIDEHCGQGAKIGEDMHDDGCPGSDGTQERVARVVHDNHLMTFLVLLKFESDRHHVA
jgi:hypothetical protein